MCDLSEQLDHAPDCECDVYEEPPDHFGLGFLIGLTLALILCFLGGASYFSAHPEKHTGKVRVISGEAGFTSWSARTMRCSSCNSMTPTSR